MVNSELVEWDLQARGHRITVAVIDCRLELGDGRLLVNDEGAHAI